MTAMGPLYQPGEEHGYAEPPERTLADDEMVTMVGPDGSVHQVDRETAAAATALMVDIETRMTAAYEQGKEVGRVNGAARLDEARMKIAELVGTVMLVRDQRDALYVQCQEALGLRGGPERPAPCGDGRCYCGGCVL